MRYAPVGFWNSPFGRTGLVRPETPQKSPCAQGLCFYQISSVLSWTLLTTKWPAANCTLSELSFEPAKCRSVLIQLTVCVN